MLKTNQWKVTMVSPNQIASKHYRCCTTTKAVQNFCTRYGVNHFWWTPPQGSHKVFMIDAKSFRSYWSQVYGKTQIPSSRKITTKTTAFSRTTSSNRTNTPKRSKNTTTNKTYSFHRNKGTKTTFRRAA